MVDLMDLGTDSTELIDSLQERDSDSCNELHALLTDQTRRVVTWQ